MNCVWEESVYKAGDGQDIRFLNKSANFPIHLPESSSVLPELSGPSVSCGDWRQKSCYLFLELRTTAG